MSLRFFGKDPNSDEDNCPSAWVDEETREIVVQGWKPGAAMMAEVLATGQVPESEAVVRLPASMANLIREACDAATGSAVL